MTTEERADAVQRVVFGEVAELYDAVRPGYADALATEVLAYADLNDRTAVEIGAGTGKATRLFAERGVPLVCVEPDPRMADVLRRNTAGHPNVRVEVSDFEAWQPGDRRFGLLYAATCWHWFDPDRRWDLVHAALEPGGAVALFWNPRGILDAELSAELAAIDEAGHTDAAADYGDRAGDWCGAEGWPEEECRSDGRFTDLRATRFQTDVFYDTRRYLDLLASTSTYRMLPEDRRSRALADTGRLLDARGGGVAMREFSDLFLARRR